MNGGEPKTIKLKTGQKPRKPRVRLNFSRNLAGSLASNDGPKTKPYMQGYDRELDSEDEETGEGMAFEEQLILRLPDGPGVDGELDQLRKTIKKRGTLPDTWFKFKDSRRAVFFIAGQPYSAKIVDLPCIVESHKTLDNKQIFKIADISQMLLVEHAVSNESEAVGASSSARDGGQTKTSFNVDDYIYPHGITPPMQWARKRRFRKRIHNRAIDTVEKEVENLLNDDRRAEKVEFDYVEPAEADMIEEEIAKTKFDQPNTVDDEAESQRQSSEEDEYDESSRREAEDDEENVDQVLAAELDAALAREHDREAEESASNSDNDNDNSDEERSRADSDLEDLWDEENEDENDENADENEVVNDADKEDDEGEGDGEEEAERRVRESQLEAECREIETLLRRKQQDLDSTLNALIKSRHQQALRKLQVELDVKKKHLQDIKQLRRAIRVERAAEAEARAESAATANSAPAASRDDTSNPADLTDPPPDSYVGEDPSFG